MSEFEKHQPKVKDIVMDIEFRELHGIDVGTARHARAIVEANLQIIDHFTQTGDINLDIMNRMVSDPELRNLYTEMAMALAEHDTKKFKYMHDEIFLNIPLYCGWLDFFNEYLSNITNINFIQLEPKDGYEDFLENNAFYGEY